MTTLQHDRIAALAAELRLTALPDVYGAIAPTAAKSKHASFADFLEDVLCAERDAAGPGARDADADSGLPGPEDVRRLRLRFRDRRRKPRSRNSPRSASEAENVVLLGPGWKVRFTSAADLVIALEAAQRHVYEK